MRRVGSTLLIAALCTSVAACGSRKALKPVEGAPPVPVAVGAEAPETSDELMEASTQARPDRSAEPLKRSQEREEDPFDLPPQ
ncbi:MAG: hypothetical protein R3E11_11300 [Sphingobium sp.]